jgi:uncharacterized protein (DUF433 family)
MGTERITSNPNILFGKPVIRGTRIPVELIVEKFADGETVESILQSYPHLKKEDIASALEFAAQVLRSDIIYPVEAA